jgi:superfamily II DNA or RNA helicase
VIKRFLVKKMKYPFVGVINSNDSNSRIQVVRSKNTSFSVLQDDHKSQDILEKKKVSFSKTFSTPPLHVKVSTEEGGTFVIPIEECKRAIVTGKHQFNPKPQQKALLQRLCPSFFLPKTNTSEVFMVFWSMGSGKTKGVLNCLRQVVFPSPPSVVVVCPKSCVSNWRNEITSLPFHEDADKDNLTYFDIMCDTQLKKVLTNQSSFLANKILIFDECQILRNLTTDGASIINASHKASVRILLTGTPIVNSADEIRYLAMLASNRKGEGDSIKSLETLYKGKIHYYTMEEKAQVQKKVLEPVKVPMTWFQTFTYFENESSSIKYYGHTIQTSNRNSYDVRLRLASNYVNDNHCPKIKKLIENIQKYEYPQVVHSAYLESGLQPVEKMLNKKVGNVFVFDGKLSGKERQALINLYNSGKVNVLLMSNAGSLGINLKWTQAFHNLDPFPNKADYDQAVGRALRMNSYTGTPPSPKHNNFLTEITYLASFPKASDLKPSEVNAVAEQISPFYKKLIPEKTEYLASVKDFLLSNLTSHKLSNDQRVWARSEEKQHAIEKLVDKLKEIGKDDSIKQMYQKRAKQQEYRQNKTNSNSSKNTTPNAKAKNTKAKKASGNAKPQKK